MGQVVGTTMRSTRHRHVRLTDDKEPFLSRRSVRVAVVVLFAVTMLNNLRGRGGIQPAPEVEAETAQASVMVAVGMVEEYRREHGELPPSLAAAGLSEERFEYRRRWDGGFELESTVGSQAVRYNSAEGPEGLLRTLAPPTGGRR